MATARGELHQPGVLLEQEVQVDHVVQRKGRRVRAGTPILRGERGPCRRLLLGCCVCARTRREQDSDHLGVGRVGDVRTAVRAGEGVLSWASRSRGSITTTRATCAGSKATPEASSSTASRRPRRDTSYCTERIACTSAWKPSTWSTGPTGTSRCVRSGTDRCCGGVRRLPVGAHRHATRARRCPIRG